MKSAASVTAIAAVLSLITGAQSLAQGIVQGPPVVYDQRNDPAYQRKLDNYQDQQQRYEASRDTYLIQQDRYRQDREAYRYARDAYDARYGIGAYDRYRVDWYRPYANSPCERGARGAQATGGVIGALAGAAIGSNIAARNTRTEGAVLGALVGGALGASIGGSTARCDSRGYYYTFNQTVPYDEGYGYDGRSGRYDRVYYGRQRCRLAAAPAYWDGVTDYRYVRVCPDRMGRYRFAG